MLQGSLDDFALVEILSLLAENSKSGQLDIDGDRGTGVLVFGSGKLVDARASKCDGEPSREDVMFELLRYQQGRFIFLNKEVELTGDEKNVSSVLAVAESRLAEWQSIAAVVPSLQHLVSPVVELPEDEVTINRDEWAALSIIAAGCPVSIVCDELDVGEVEGCRKIKYLIERKLVQLNDPAGSSPELPPQQLMETAEAVPDEDESYDEESPDDESFDEAELDRASGLLSTPPAPRSSGGSLVESLRGTPDTAPPVAEDRRGAVPAGATNGAQNSATGEGLLMRYLKGDEE